VEQLGNTLDASKVVIRLGTEDRLLSPNGDEDGDTADEVDAIDDTAINDVAADTIKFNVADVIGSTDITDRAEEIDVTDDNDDIDDNDDPDQEASA
jgi:hypothetical protein